jgi:hypothetical protein
MFVQVLRLLIKRTFRCLCVGDFGVFIVRKRSLKKLPISLFMVVFLLFIAKSDGFSRTFFAMSNWHL